jgi:ribosomal protein S18 acetylase RimI-like enzyme
MSTITVRQAVLSDIDALAPLFDDYRRFYGRPGDLSAAREFLLHRFDHNESVLFLAHDSDVPVGFAQLYPSFSSVWLARTFILNDLFVAEGARRSGAGSMLLAAALEYAKLLGAMRLTLSTAITNETAQSLYESTGWTRDSEFVVYHHVVAAR